MILRLRYDRFLQHVYGVYVHRPSICSHLGTRQDAINRKPGGAKCKKGVSKSTPPWLPPARGRCYGAAPTRTPPVPTPLALPLPPPTPLPQFCRLSLELIDSYMDNAEGPSPEPADRAVRFSLPSFALLP